MRKKLSGEPLTSDEELLLQKLKESFDCKQN